MDLVYAVSLVHLGMPSTHPTPHPPTPPPPAPLAQAYQPKQDFLFFVLPFYSSLLITEKQFWSFGSEVARMQKSKFPSTEYQELSKVHWCFEKVWINISALQNVNWHVSWTFTYLFGFYWKNERHLCCFRIFRLKRFFNFLKEINMFGKI